MFSPEQLQKIDDDMVHRAREMLYAIDKLRSATVEKKDQRDDYLLFCANEVSDILVYLDPGYEQSEFKEVFYPTVDQETGLNSLSVKKIMVWPMDGKLATINECYIGNDGQLYGCSRPDTACLQLAIRELSQRDSVTLEFLLADFIEEHRDLSDEHGLFNQK